MYTPGLPLVVSTMFTPLRVTAEIFPLVELQSILRVPLVMTQSLALLVLMLRVANAGVEPSAAKRVTPKSATVAESNRKEKGLPTLPQLGILFVHIRVFS